VSIRRRRRSGAGPDRGVVIAVAVMVLVLVGIGWYWLRSGEDPDTASPAPPPTAEAPSPLFPEDTIPPLDLPELGASDAFVRGVVGRLSAHPQLAAWLVNDRLIQRFVLTVVELAGGSNPSEHVPFLMPQQEFQVREVDGRVVMAPESHRRYDLLTTVFTSLDTRGTVRLYRQLHPLIDEAFQELGIPGVTFDETLAQALANLRAVEIPPGTPELVRHEAVWEYRDPALENRRGGEKALLRAGPENVRRIQEKLGELETELGFGR
jgi:hypothetical protein